MQQHYDTRDNIENMDRVVFKLETGVEESMNSSEKIDRSIAAANKTSSYHMKKNETSFFRDLIFPVGRKPARRSSSAPILNPEEAIVASAVATPVHKNSTEATMLVITSNHRNATSHILESNRQTNQNFDTTIAAVAMSRSQQQINDFSSDTSGNSILMSAPPQSPPMVRVKNKPPESPAVADSASKSKYKTRIKKLFS